MSDNTYVSHFTRNRRGRRQLFADKDLYGKNVFSQTLFENLKRFWKNYHNDNKRFFWWIEIILDRLERSIRIKWLADLTEINFFNNYYSKINTNNLIQTILKKILKTILHIYKNGRQKLKKIIKNLIEEDIEKYQHHQ